MNLPMHMASGFDFDEAIEMAELCRRVQQMFAHEEISAEDLYNSLYRDDLWHFVHIVRNHQTDGAALIVKKADTNQYVIAFRADAATAQEPAPAHQEMLDNAQEIPILNRETDAEVNQAATAHSPATRDEAIRSVEYPLLAGELTPPLRGARVHQAWLATFAPLKDEIESFFNGLALSNRSELEIYVTGHGVGSCLAVFCVLHLKRTWETQIDFPFFNLKMYNFGSPKIGNKAFVEYYNQQMKGFSYRVQNMLDGLTYAPAVKAPFPYNLQLMLPGVDYVRQADKFYMAYEHVGEVYPLPGLGNPKLNFNGRASFKPVFPLPFAHNPDGYKEMLLEARKYHEGFWQPTRKFIETFKQQSEQLAGAFKKQTAELQKTVRDFQDKASQ
jgi:hypothetical protein